MKYAQMRKFDTANGPGIRAVLFVSGCTHDCPDCFNKEYQDFGYGTQWSKEAEDKFIGYIKDENVVGVTILGGEPMQQDESLVELLKRIKSETSKDIWIYSGYTYDAIIKDKNKVKLLEQCDVLVDGPFIKELNDFRLKFRGSSNQRIIDIKESLKTGDIVELNI